MIRLLGLFLVLIFIGGWIYLKSQDEGLTFDFISLLDGGNFFYLGIAFAVFILINFLRALRFFFLINQEKLVNKKRSFVIILASLPLAFFFTGSGLALRCLMLKKENNLSLTKTISLFSLEKVVDLFVVGIMFIFLGINVFMQKNIGFEYTKQIYLLFFITLVILLFFYWRNFFLKIFIRVVHFFSKRLKWKRKIISFEKTLNRIFTTKKMLSLAGFTLLIWLAEYFFVFFFMQSFDAQLTFYPSLIIFILIQLCIIFPVAPSGVGVWESAFIIASNILNLENTNILTIALVSHFFLTIFFIVFFLMAFYNLKLSLKDLKRIFQKITKSNKIST